MNKKNITKLLRSMQKLASAQMNNAGTLCECHFKEKDRKFVDDALRRCQSIGGTSRWVESNSRCGNRCEGKCHWMIYCSENPYDLEENGRQGDIGGDALMISKPGVCKTKYV